MVPLTLTDVPGVNALIPGHFDPRDCMQRYEPVPLATRPIVASVNEYALSFQIPLPLPAKNAAIGIKHDAHAVSFCIADVALVPEVHIVWILIFFFSRMIDCDKIKG